MDASEEAAMRRTATLTEGGTIAIPQEIRRALGVEEGDTIVFEVNEGGSVRLLAQADDDPLARFIGIWRTGEGTTIEQIVAEQREMRGWDEYDHRLADNDDRN
jgi:AbrB family looped-hinge helix DNA binding protein